MSYPYSGRYGQAKACPYFAKLQGQDMSCPYDGAKVLNMKFVPPMADGIQDSGCFYYLCTLNF